MMATQSQQTTASQPQQPTTAPQLVAKKPINFCTNVEADTLLRVFDQDFHAHSAILKMHSTLFRTFFDSPDKVAKGSSTKDKFKYEWVTNIEPLEREWTLVCSTSVSLHEVRHAILFFWVLKTNQLG